MPMSRPNSRAAQVRRANAAPEGGAHGAEKGSMNLFSVLDHGDELTGVTLIASGPFWPWRDS